ncbi:hypothetical protein SHJG_p1004 (plasmid) [Streptomyces hygroscopicus subsp. jinggangensis 5008]|nr:hypothetical protein SHJG_p1004 [Streptomyces hygroscopicus subsp. jinggangensis 5008]AGF68289.1 hypothetical protein SHJGH_p1004 [Streptomyces hygroscopicus subsp. jinggangensis TL01]
MVGLMAGPVVGPTTVVRPGLERHPGG